MSLEAACGIVVCLLKSVIQDQLKEALSKGLMSTSLASARLGDVENSKYKLIFMSKKISQYFLFPEKEQFTIYAIYAVHNIAPKPWCNNCQQTSAYIIIIIKYLYSANPLFVHGTLH